MSGLKGPAVTCEREGESPKIDDTPALVKMVSRSGRNCLKKFLRSAGKILAVAGVKSYLV
jgi:hypothetical protein